MAGSTENTRPCATSSRHPPLTDAFLRGFERSSGCSSAGLTPDARAALMRHDWPGNVRELHNALERAVILRDGELITAAHLSL